MTEIENLILDHLRHMRSAIDALREDMREVKTRLSILENQYAILTNQYAAVSTRLDRLDARVERIERRLDLFEAPVS
jgi:predicted nuclease with TOPRIM domain